MGRLKGAIVGNMAEYDIAPEEMAKMLGLDLSSWYRKVRDSNFSYEQLCILASYLHFTDDQKIRVL